MTSRKKVIAGKESIVNEAEAPVALDGETQAYQPIDADTATREGLMGPVEGLDEEAVDVTPPYAFRYHKAVEFLTGLTNGTMEMVEDELLSVFGRGEFTAFVFRRNRSHIIVPEYDEETEAMPYAENDEPRILQTTARFTAHNNAWSYGAGPRTSLLEYGD